ncbi:MAG: FGGY-family carbohydrate kinase [Clostridiales bacterium]|nr:FGGY-family carbohydrate kinase [Clostridiales bacterium]
MNREKIRKLISDGQAVLGIELGSTRIKAVLIDDNHDPIASGSHTWQNRYEDGIWTYSMEDVWTGIQDSYRNLCREVEEKYDVEITSLKALGFSAMMHGYLPFDKNGSLLVPYRTWRNTITEKAASELTALFNFNIPQRWCIAHLYQAILNEEPHVADIDFITTLAGYVHWQLSGEKVLGVGDASGVFPIDSNTNDYSSSMIEKFDELIAPKKYPWKLRDIIPKILNAGDKAGVLTPDGAKKLDPSGKLRAGIPMAPPEGDAGTGMVATNSVAVRTGNVSAGTSIFAMIVLEKTLSRVYEEVDMVTTPSGKPVAMVHCNNCTSDIDDWANMMCGFAEALGHPCTINQALDALFYTALEGDADCGGLVAYNYLSGEHNVGLEEGRPLFVRLPDARFTFANFARAHLYTAIATLRLGMNILLEKEQVKIDSMMGHGGFFKAKGVGQKFMAAALNTSVSVMETAGEGGPWGMALLAAYMVNKDDGETLEDYLAKKVFADKAVSQIEPDIKDVQGFNQYIKKFEAGLEVEKAAVTHIR